MSRPDQLGDVPRRHVTDDLHVLRFPAVNVSVQVTGPRNDVAGYLAARYAGLGPVRGRPRRKLEASYRLEKDQWVVEVLGRPSRTVTSLEEVAQTLDQELVYGIAALQPAYEYVEAGVVSHDGQAVVLPGLLRSGKESLVLALIQAGARYLSDALLVYDAESVSARAFPRAIGLSEEEVAAFPDLIPSMHRLGSLRVVPPESLGLDIIDEQSPLGAIVVPEWEPVGEEHVEPIPRTQAQQSLAEARVEPAPPPEDGGATLGATARCYALRWRDPHRAAALLMDELSR